VRIILGSCGVRRLLYSWIGLYFSKFHWQLKKLGFGVFNSTLCRFSGRAVWGAGLERLYNGSRVRITLKAWMFVLVSLCCFFLCRYMPCDELITRPSSPTVCRWCIVPEVILNWNMPQGLIRRRWKKNSTLSFISVLHETYYISCDMWSIVP
jgi:hypothetical protein